MVPSREIERLIEIMAALRRPGSGCPWDLEQTFRTVAPYTIEEAYEVADAIERGDLEDLRDELGDLLLQVVFHARMAEEAGAFDFGDVVEAITAKLIRRHPHVFGEARDLSPDEVKGVWDAIKAAERSARARASRDVTAVRPGLLDGDRPGVAGPHPRRETDPQGRDGRLRLARDRPGRRQDPRGDRRGRRCGRRGRARADRGRDRRSPVRGRQSRPASQGRCGSGVAAAPTPSSSGASRRSSGASPIAGAHRDEASLDEMERLWSEAKAAERTGHPRPEPGPKSKAQGQPIQEPLALLGPVPSRSLLSGRPQAGLVGPPGTTPS